MDEGILFDLVKYQGNISVGFFEKTKKENKALRDIAGLRWLMVLHGLKRESGYPLNASRAIDVVGRRIDLRRRT